jgi:hypothetical protein
MRQTGVYHCYSPTTKRSICILLHPMADSRAHARLQSVWKTSGGVKTFGEHPLNLHMLILSSYVNNWQIYLDDLARTFKSLVFITKTSCTLPHADSVQREKVVAIDISERADYNLKPETLKTLRILEDKVLFRTAASVRASITTVRALKGLNETLDQLDEGEKRIYKNMDNTLSAYLDRLESHLNSVNIMEKRIGATIGLVSTVFPLQIAVLDPADQVVCQLAQLLDLKNQDTADKINSNMLRLTEETVEDNATVKVITFFTLLYLPASFVTVS